MKLGQAIVIGSSGGIGTALLKKLDKSGLWSRVVGLSRSSTPPVNLLDEKSIADAVRYCSDLGQEVQLVIDATGVLSWEGYAPEKSYKSLDPDDMTHAFAINATGPALLMKHFLPLLARDQKSVFATLSARVGSIEDNHYGGWYSYRASKAALNQFVRTAAIELSRKNKNAVCVALHPGTVDTRLSKPFSKSGLDVQDATTAAGRLLHVIDGLSPDQTGCFFDHHGKAIPW
ncbi:NAD(P)-dependent dehydrogenase (short-subunit alcohol dehydrogenase family) [Roseibium hamelinense]|uniref:NAD(P)-dependent dehydrogenase (Short-subunit alcohol dehydrogenase family) n=1 Tax=Roseibium hamelinense TaxID=150831 RepID=A0A562SLY4_9HYPH|nr:SDR family NAD(P)-dependent oxidoreductase [Roseibium hamelinense]MTI45092.1 SDR family NAD(P)-dependent oxidoreductase [Roseibium hamelinense]TWI82359.1 NAD(P)-dependent dehydrogenase (short-subunit alcohol dehydrogenase family) [Roseibium hamelinense]